MFGIWSRFGFSGNPYSQETLPPDEMGSGLLVGRDSEVQQIQSRIASNGVHPSVEGPVGVGKTSLINVAIYRMTDACLRAKSGELYLAATQRFQPIASAADFELDVFRVVAQTLIRWKKSLPEVGLIEPDLTKLERWLNSPQYGTTGGGLSILGSGANVEKASEPNTSDGFATSGFPAIVRNALEDSFPQGSGAIVCVLDNLEILETAGAARSRLDELRDRLFNIPQLRWVLCGSRGIVSRARTERLSGIFMPPLALPALSDADAIGAIAKRIEYFSVHNSQAPVTPTAFEFIYRAINSNMRDALAMAQDFSHWIADEYPDPSHLPNENERDDLLQVWLTEKAEQAFRDAAGVQARVWTFFEMVCSIGGRAGSSQYEDFDFGFQQQMSGAVTSLVNANLMVREVDPDNASRTINAITALGWLVYFYRARFEFPKPRADVTTPGGGVSS
jgi:hypothetical protein